MQNVYEGAVMAGAPTGRVKKLRVIGLEYRPVHIGWNWQFGWHSTQGKIGTPIAVGNGAYDVKHVLGEADVEADGSCSFKAPAAMDLRGTRGQLPPSDDQSKRKYSTAYLSLTYKGQCNEKINFAHGLGFAPFKPPYSFGAARSSVWRMLAKGHHDVRLTDAELHTLACWIDLAVPFCGSYVEHHDWNDWYRQRYEYTCNKRAAFAWLELNDIRKGLGLPPVPLTGFDPDVAEPRRQKYWSE